MKFSKILEENLMIFISFIFFSIWKKTENFIDYFEYYYYFFLGNFDSDEDMGQESRSWNAESLIAH